jgi:hypothetical protein
VQESTSISALGIFDDFYCPPLETLISASHFSITPSVGVSQILNFGSVPIDFSPPGLRFEGEMLACLQVGVLVIDGKIIVCSNGKIGTT